MSFYFSRRCSDFFHLLCYAGINPYVIAFTALASGTSWPDLVASKIAAERQTTADSAIANITCRQVLSELHYFTSYSLVYVNVCVEQCSGRSVQTNINSRLNYKVCLFNLDPFKKFLGLDFKFCSGVDLYPLL